MQGFITRRETGRLRQFWILLVAAVLVWAGMMPAAAQVTPAATSAAPATVPIEQLERLKTTLQDETQRNALIANIEALIAVEQQQADATDETGGRLGREMVKILAEAQEGLDSVPPLFSRLSADADQVQTWVVRTWRDPAPRANVARQVALFAAILGVGWLVEYGLWMLLAPVRRRLMTHTPPTLAGRLRSGLRRAAIELLPIIGFFAAAAAFGVIGGSATRLTAAALALALVYGIVRALLALARLLLAPRAAGLRLVSLSTPDAADLYRWLRRIILVFAVATVVVLWTRVIGLLPAAERLVSGIAVLCGSLVVAAFVLSQRRQWNA